MRGTRKSIWHDAKEKPQGDGFIIMKSARIGHERGKELYACAEDVKRYYTWSKLVEDCRIEKWCYETDLEKV